MSPTQIQGSNDRTRKRRSACDQCHTAKVKCLGRENPCQRCAQNSLSCHYSFAARMGKPPGSKNKKTLERMQAAASSQTQHTGTPHDDLQTNSIMVQSPNQTNNGKQQPNVQDQVQPEEDVNRLASPSIATLLSLMDTENILGHDATSIESSNTGYGISTSLNCNNTEENSNPFTFLNTSFDDPWNFLSMSLPSSHLDSDFNVNASFLESGYTSPPLRIRSIDSLSGIAASLDRSNEFNADMESDLLSNRSLFTSRSQTTPSNSSVASSTVNSNRSHSSSSSRSLQQSCQCYKSQTTSLYHLRMIEQRQSPVMIDTVLNCTRLVAVAAEKQIACQQCRSEINSIPTLNLTLMTFQPIFRWAGALAHHLDQPCPELGSGTEIRLGTYEIMKDDASVIKNILVAREYEKMHRALTKVRQRVEIVAAEVDRRASQRDRQRDLDLDFERGEVQNLLGLSQNLLQTSAIFAKRLREKRS